MDRKKPNGLAEGSPLGLSGDFQRIRQGSKATAGELREFMDAMRGKSPQEMLGLVAQSGLFQGLVTATLGTVVLVAIMTIIPYSWSKLAVADAPAKAEEATEAPAAPATTPTTPAPTTTDNTAAAPSPDAKRTLDALGESEVKDADPTKNPLDKLDDLLELE